MPSEDMPSRTREQKNGKETPEEKKSESMNKKEQEDEEIGKGEPEDKGNPVDCTQHWENEAHMEDGQNEYKKFKESEAMSQNADVADGDGKDANDEAASNRSRTTNESGSQNGEEEQTTAKKRGGGANQKGANKKQKVSKGEPRGKAGDKTRVPEEGQKVQWSALPGLVDGEVVEVVYKEKTVEGKSVKGGKEDARIVLKSSASGKIAVHKPEAVHFE